MPARKKTRRISWHEMCARNTPNSKSKKGQQVRATETRSRPIQAEADELRQRLGQSTEPRETYSETQI